MNFDQPFQPFQLQTATNIPFVFFFHPLLDLIQDYDHRAWTMITQTTTEIQRQRPHAEEKKHTLPKFNIDSPQNNEPYLKPEIYTC